MLQVASELASNHGQGAAGADNASSGRQRLRPLLLSAAIALMLGAVPAHAMPSSPPATPGSGAGGNGGASSGTPSTPGGVGGSGYGVAGGNGANGTGGTGASISNVKLTSVSEFVRAIAAGNGGDATGPEATESAGGSISNVSVPGAIGDFSSAFNTASITSGQGGLIVGTGGAGDAALNGSITDVSAKAIATIIAGRWDGSNSTITGLGTTLAGLSTTRAVLSITGLSAQVIGADLWANGIVSDSTSAAWEVDDTNSLVDGIVLVQTATAAAGPYTIGQQI